MPIVPDGSDLLLIQIRDSHEVADHELRCVSEAVGIDESRFARTNIVEEPELDYGLVERARAVIIGGAAVHSAVEDEPFDASLIPAIRRMADEGTPVFGSCWGHQYIARALGGEVVHDEAHAEVGAYEIELTPEASSDPVFAGSPARFEVLMGHHDRVDRLPPGAVELASSERCRNQAFRIAGKPVYGAQFHTELDHVRLIERLSVYRAYCPSDEDFEAVRAAVRPTPHARALLGRFLASFAGPSAG